MHTALLAIGMVAIGMAGLHLNIEYSGWILFIGLIAALNCF